MTPATRASGGPADRKAVLFCPACSHEAPLDGEWSLETREGVESDRTDVRCPQCGQVVVSQPWFSDDDRSVDFVGPVLQLFDAVVGHHVL
jgi:DNA-directed RNA polymerase subunit RPC12/RpoP